MGSSTHLLHKNTTKGLAKGVFFCRESVRILAVLQPVPHSQTKKPTKGVFFYCESMKILFVLRPAPLSKTSKTATAKIAPYISSIVPVCLIQRSSSTWRQSKVWDGFSTFDAFCSLAFSIYGCCSSFKLKTTVAVSNPCEKSWQASGEEENCFKNFSSEL